MIALAARTGAPDARRETALRLAEAALRAVDAEGATSLALRGLALPRDPFVLAFGKAAVGMARAALRVAPEARGFVVGPTGEDVGPLRGRRGGHPLPADDAEETGRAVLQVARALEAGDVALCLVSGGGSAMLELPRDGVSLQQIRELTRSALRGGAPIERLNAQRTALSALKGGGLARAMAPARIVNVLISDVPGSEPSVIASGPTWDGGEHVVAADNEVGQAALIEAGAALGLRLVRVHEVLRGEARAAGARLAALAARRMAEDPGIDGLVAGGETTVTVTGRGRGGRNGELVAGAVPELGSHLLLSLATDGVDGTSGSAGALVDPAGVVLGQALGGPLELALQENDTARWLRAAGLLLETGPTGTNVADLQLLLR